MRKFFSFEIKKQWTSPLEWGLIHLNKKQTPEEGKMSPVKYYTIMRKSKDPRWIRYEMVRYAKEEGVKPAARVFSICISPFRATLHLNLSNTIPCNSKYYKTLRTHSLI
ncbi:MAG: hypothetical protein MUO91_09150 [candidate division Zixibacteria bacterium]|nr:hypothetical protein [candidate division Zixibacteria bacterium]